MIDYPHEQTIHCENGAIRNMLKLHHLEISEPLIFGIGSGISFTHIPFLTMDSFRLTMPRPAPVAIFKNFAAAFGFKLYHQKFFSKKQSMQQLDDLLAQGIPVGLVVNLLHLNYFPAEHRGNFNGHHIVVYGKEENRYYVSDTMPELPDGREIMTREELLRVRFSNSILSPRGSLFYLKDVPQELNLYKGVWIGIQKTCKEMLHHPIKYFGIKGLFLLSDEMKKWDRKFTFADKKANLRHLVRLFEDAGTGRSAFRYLYARFLKEAAVIGKEEKLAILSTQMTAIADLWQNFSLQMLRYTKFVNEENVTMTLIEISDLLLEIAHAEKELFEQLEQLLLKHQDVFID